MANIARLPQNYLSWHEELDRNPPWLSTRIDPPPSGQPSPDGRGAASILHEDGTPATSHLLIYNGPLVKKLGYQYTIGCRAMAINRSWIRLVVILDGAFASCFYDVANGLVGTANASVDDARIRLIATDWYECWFTYLNNTPGGIASQIQMYISEADNDFTFDGLDQDSLYIWRPQLNEGWGLDDSFLTQEVPRT